MWSRWVDTVDVWKEWCLKVYKKINNPQINSQEVLNGVLQPQIINQRPQSYAYRIDWPNEFDICCDKNIYIQAGVQSIPIYEMEIGLLDDSLMSSLKFYVKSDNIDEEFELK